MCMNRRCTASTTQSVMPQGPVASLCRHGLLFSVPPSSSSPSCQTSPASERSTSSVPSAQSASLSAVWPCPSTTVLSSFHTCETRMCAHRQNPQGCTSLPEYCTAYSLMIEWRGSHQSTCIWRMVFSLWLAKIVNNVDLDMPCRLLAS